MTIFTAIALAVFNVSVGACPAPPGTPAPAFSIEQMAARGEFDGVGDGAVRLDPDTPLALVPLVVAHETYGHWCLFVTGGRWRDERLATARARELLAR